MQLVILTGSIDPAPALHLPLVKWTLSFLFYASGLMLLFILRRTHGLGKALIAGFPTAMKFVLPAPLLRCRQVEKEI
jgi:hypothetical protein